VNSARTVQGCDLGSHARGPRAWALLHHNKRMYLPFQLIYGAAHKPPLFNFRLVKYGSDGKAAVRFRPYLLLIHIHQARNGLGMGKGRVAVHACHMQHMAALMDKTCCCKGAHMPTCYIYSSRAYVKVKKRHPGDELPN
jgi:hypothetical protein